MSAESPPSSGAVAQMATQPVNPFIEFPPIQHDFPPGRSFNYCENNQPKKFIDGDVVLKEARNTYVVTARTTQGKAIVVKCGIVSAEEANKQHFLREQGGLSLIPKVHGYYQVDVWSIMVMDFVPGKPLRKDIWDKFGSSGQSNFKNSLAAALTQMRRLKSPKICGFNGEDIDLWRYNSLHKRTYDLESHYVETKLRLLGANSVRRWEEEFKEATGYLTEHRNLARPVEFVATHGDLYSENILVGADGVLTGLVDVANAEYLPEYCEIAFLATDGNSDWYNDALFDALEMVCPTYKRDDPIVKFETVLRSIATPVNTYKMTAWYGPYGRKPRDGKGPCCQIL